jgi:hypothetical protein
VIVRKRNLLRPKARAVIGLTLQHNPVFPLIAKSTHPIADGFINAKPLQDYLRAHPRSRFVRMSDVFPEQRTLRKSDFYRKYMAPTGYEYAIGLLFWRGRLLMAMIVIMRTAKQGDLTRRQLDLLRFFYPQFQTALHRMRSLEHEHAARMAFEGFLGRLPLPTILLQWDLKTVYLNKRRGSFVNLEGRSRQGTGAEGDCAHSTGNPRSMLRAQETLGTFVSWT